MKLTTNTDNLCFDTSKESNRTIRSIRLFIYRYYMWTGLVVMERHERVIFHTIVLIVIFASFFYSKAFLQGFIDGWTSLGEASL